MSSWVENSGSNQKFPDIETGFATKLQSSAEEPNSRPSENYSPPHENVDIFNEVFLSSCLHAIQNLHFEPLFETLDNKKTQRFQERIMNIIGGRDRQRSS